MSCVQCVRINNSGLHSHKVPIIIDPAPEH
jgi:hypothetical protein